MMNNELVVATNAGLVDIQIEYRSLADLLLDKRNPRQHPQRQIDQLAESIREFGFVMPVIIDSQGKVVVGHGRVLAAKKLRMLRIPIVQIRHLSPAQLKAFRIADNRLAQHSHWDARLLGENFFELKELEVDFDLSVTGFSLPEIDLSLQSLGKSQKVETDNDLIGAASGTPVCEASQIWQLGDHRIYCADATLDASFDLLMNGERAELVFVDPPFHVPVEGNVSGKGRVRQREFAQGVGELTRDEFIQFLTKACGSLAKHSREGALHYVCTEWPHADELLTTGRKVYTELKDIAIWVKRNAGSGSLYRSQHELIFVFKSGEGRHTNNIELGKQGRNRTNVWKYDSAGVQARKGNNLLALHPTAKPVQLVMDVLLDCSSRGGIVLDCFLGNGTTLLAAEQTGRICRGMELDPLCVDTVIRRWQNLTGLDAVCEATGKLFRKIEAEKGAGR
jgi:DNA modification methylase